jgi:hypothetical protein
MKNKLSMEEDSQNVCGGQQPKREMKTMWAFLLMWVVVIDKSKIKKHSDQIQ